ncbi:class I SAM-dependent methyltransferase [Nonomuraea turkmeniaca]|uniref:Class I SAM-dependent methyltransferase n=1 Tax=Nonomuraea turkmeniaca TaxID=103838 RepID=A0A5S4FJN9_9ACTN|nr:class I SAM-dependent methyltransferase [Nonomuraea turkmeniaca]TMR20872.1 class I SAM-dependent methyltransferase [Nonomuraea turkmeniaca]
MDDDHYSLAVPFYDLWHEDGHVPLIRELLPPLLKGVRRSVMEIGAGTGLITRVILQETPAEVYAVEPSSGMRSVLVNRLAEDREALSRVTVLPCGGLEAEADEPVEAVVMISVLQSFDAAQRADLWRVLRRQLEPGGLLLFNWRERATPEPGEPEIVGSYRVGRHTYEIAGQVLAVAGESVKARYVYRVKQRGVVISEDEVLSESHWPARERLVAELEGAGFARDGAPDGMEAWRLPK